jgi:hypothetical protein
MTDNYEGNPKVRRLRVEVVQRGDDPIKYEPSHHNLLVKVEHSTYELLQIIAERNNVSLEQAARLSLSIGVLQFMRDI